MEKKKIIYALMPGSITLILKKSPELPAYITNGATTIAVRMATSKLLEKLIKKTGNPIFMTSANQSGKPTCANLDEIEKTCPLLDGMLEGNVSFEKESIIVDCTLNELQIFFNGIVLSILTIA